MKRPFVIVFRACTAEVDREHATLAARWQFSQIRGVLTLEQPTRQGHFVSHCRLLNSDTITKFHLMAEMVGWLSHIRLVAGRQSQNREHRQMHDAAFVLSDVREPQGDLINCPQIGRAAALAFERVTNEARNVIRMRNSLLSRRKHEYAGRDLGPRNPIPH